MKISRAISLLTVLFFGLVLSALAQEPTPDKTQEIRDAFKGFPAEKVTSTFVRRCKSADYSYAFALLTPQTQKKINFTRFNSRMKRFKVPEGSTSAHPKKIDNERMSVSVYLMTSVSGHKRTVGSKDPIYAMELRKIDDCWLIERLDSKQVDLP